MNNVESSQWLDDIDGIIVEPLKFKVKLAIGEDAYASLKLKNRLGEVWDALGVAGTAVTIAKSSLVASTFFSSGWLAAIGIGTAVTPIGWVIGAGAVSTGAWVGLSQYIKSKSDKRVTVIPDFINTPLDILGLALFDFITPLALKLALVDGNIEQSEKQVIHDYFSNQWGYNETFVKKGIEYAEEHISEFSIDILASNLAEFKKKNPDCNYSVMSQDIILFLNELMEADGKIDKREEAIITLVESIFSEVGEVNIRKKAKAGINSVMKGSGNILNKVLNRTPKDESNNLEDDVK